MAYQPTTDELETMQKLNCACRFAIFAPTWTEHERFPDKIKQVDNGRVVCEIADIATGAFYARGEGIDKAAAFKSALSAAVKAPKPMTASQRAHVEMNASGDPRDAEIARLKAELAEARGETGVPSGVRPGRRTMSGSVTKATPAGVK